MGGISGQTNTENVFEVALKLYLLAICFQVYFLSTFFFLLDHNFEIT